MAIPDYQTLMLPLLTLIRDGTEYPLNDVIGKLADKFHLTEKERQQLYPSGRGKVFSDRVRWASTFLFHAGLISRPKRAHLGITKLGRDVLKRPPASINREFLFRFPSFKIFIEKGANRPDKDSGQSSQPSKPPKPTRKSDIETPDELLRDTASQIDEALKKDLLDRIVNAPAASFERLVVELLLAMGYGGSQRNPGQVVGRSGDGGIDGVIDQDSLGLDRVYVQAKRYSPGNAVSEPEIRAFSGSLGAAKASKGVFVTTSYFTQPARSFSDKHPFRIVLIDGEHLAGLMVSYNIGVRVVETLYLKKLDEDFFSDE